MKRTLMTGALALAIAAPVALFSVAANAVPAEYLSGKIETINTTTKVIRIAGKDVVGFTAFDVTHLKVGDEVEFTYVVTSTQNRVLDIKHMEDDRYGDGDHN